MSEFQEINQGQSGTPRWVALAVAVLAVASLVSLGVGWSALNHASTVQESAVKQNDALTQRLARSEEINQQLQSDLRVVGDKLNVTQTDLVAARKQGKAVSVLNKKLTGLETSVKSELATKASSDDVKNLSGDVTGVKNDLADTKNNLQMARSEMGTLIARNHEEIEQLRRTGQRDYIEFTITRKAPPQKLGDLVQVQLRSTNPKKSQFTVIVLADDRTFEKKNRSVNEPIFFYTGGSRSTLELVINKVTKTTASGYLSAPKSAGTSAASNSSSGQ